MRRRKKSRKSRINQYTDYLHPDTILVKIIAYLEKREHELAEVAIKKTEVLKSLVKLSLKREEAGSHGI